jgi:hypothetical protein
LALGSAPAGFSKKSNLNPLSKEKYTCKLHVPLHKTTTISKTSNISYKLCTHVLQLAYKQEKMDWAEPKENKTKKNLKLATRAI